MPHLTIEYSKSLNKDVDTHALLKAIHTSIDGCDGVDMNRVKSRLIEHENVLNGKDAHAIGMIHVTLAILSGRDIETKKSYGKALFDALKANVPEKVRQSASLTVEIRDMEQACYFR